jgi:hypothetical protein
VEQLRLSLHSPSPQVQKMAWKAIFDLVLCHGAAALDQAASVGTDLGLPTPHPRPPGHHIPHVTLTDSQQTELSERRKHLPLLELLEDCLYDEISMAHGQEETEYVSSIIGIAAEGFAKMLLLNKRFQDVGEVQDRIVEELLILYFSDTKTYSPRSVHQR